MKTRVETITPVKAADILDKHWVREHQRKPSNHTVESYARAMRSGQWILTHQGIAIDTDGELVDGIHRLLAVVESGVDVLMMVTRDVPHNGAMGTMVIDAIDRGRVRGVGQQLSLRHGIKSGTIYAAAAKMLLWLCAHKRGLFVRKFSVGEALRVDEFYGRELRHCIHHKSNEYGIRLTSVVGACSFAMKVYPSDMKDFYHQLTTGENLKSGDPALTLRRYLSSADSGAAAGRLKIPRAVMTCAMKHINQEKIKKVYDTAHGYEFFYAKQQRASAKLLRSCGFEV